MGEPTRILRIASETGRFTYEAWRVRKDGVRFLASVAIDAIFRPDGTLRGFAKVTHDITAQRMGEEQRASDFTQRLRKADEKSEADTSARQVVEATNADLDRLARHLAKARDRADQANRAKSRFLAGMSHELRTPLNCILGYAQLLRVEGGLNARQGMRVGAMLEAGQHLLEMITCVLDLSEIESERVEMRAVAFDVQAVAEACLGLVRPLVDSKGLALGMAVAPGTPRDLVADPIWLRQVLLNLLGNAAKFTSQGSIELRLKPWADGSMLRIEVADTGPGVPADQRPRLFQEFERLDTAATRAVEGAGLGLSLSARLAGLMGGQIGHDDNPPGGSVFWLDLPRNTPATAPAAASDEPADQSAPSPARALHVLVVDDVLMNRDIAGSFLREAGHRVTCAEGGAEAVAAVENTDFDVVLMDVRMPEMDGLEATRRIRALPGARGRVPIVALTAQAFLDQIDECRAAGMDSHQVKPLQMEALLAAVARAFAAGPRPEGVAPPAIVVAPTSIDKRPQVLDADVFARTAACLSPEAVTSYLRTIAELGETLRRRLDASGAEAHADDELAEVAHTLAGSAGMFGFARLSSVGLRFERATRMGAAEAPALVGELRDAVEAMRREVYALTT
jgi:signal transduction histidine kinase/DNA-binding response OmpR family regulator